MRLALLKRIRPQDGHGEVCRADREHAGSIWCRWRLDSRSALTFCLTEVVSVMPGSWLGSPITPLPSTFRPARTAIRKIGGTQTGVEGQVCGQGRGVGRSLQRLTVPRQCPPEAAAARLQRVREHGTAGGRFGPKRCDQHSLEALARTRTAWSVADYVSASRHLPCYFPAGQEPKDRCRGRDSNPHALASKAF